jgi:hypothetical protein
VEETAPPARAVGAVLLSRVSTHAERRTPDRSVRIPRVGWLPPDVHSSSLGSACGAASRRDPEKVPTPDVQIRRMSRERLDQHVVPRAHADPSCLRARPPPRRGGPIPGRFRAALCAAAIPAGPAWSRVDEFRQGRDSSALQARLLISFPLHHLLFQRGHRARPGPSAKRRRWRVYSPPRRLTWYRRWPRGSD